MPSPNAVNTRNVKLLSFDFKKRRKASSAAKMTSTASTGPRISNDMGISSSFPQGLPARRHANIRVKATLSAKRPRSRRDRASSCDKTGASCLRPHPSAQPSVKYETALCPYMPSSSIGLLRILLSTKLSMISITVATKRARRRQTRRRPPIHGSRLLKGKERKEGNRGLERPRAERARSSACAEPPGWLSLHGRPAPPAHSH